MVFKFHAVQSAHQQRVTALALSPWNATVASADIAGTVILWDPETHREKARILTEPFEGKVDVVTSLSFHPQTDNSLFVGCMSGQAFHYSVSLVSLFYNFSSLLCGRCSHSTKGTSVQLGTGVIGAPVTRIAVGKCSNLLALAVGSEVHLLRSSSTLGDHWTTCTILPQPLSVAIEGAEEEDDIAVQGLHFCGSDRHLVICYLKQGAV